MSGNRIGGLKTRDKNLSTNPNFYRELGRKGGQNGHEGKGFASYKVGTDGLTGFERASKVGVIGGKNRRKARALEKQS